VLPSPVLQRLAHWDDNAFEALQISILSALAMYDWQNFDTVFQSKLDCSYDEKTVNTILKNRKELAGTLFFDRVWSNLGLKDGKH
jgi:hypothetical protein